MNKTFIETTKISHLLSIYSFFCFYLFNIIIIYFSLSFYFILFNFLRIFKSKYTSRNLHMFEETYYLHPFHIVDFQYIKLARGY